MFDENNTKSEKVGEFPNIESLASEHDRISREIDELPLTRAAEEQRRRLNDRSWAIRAVITTTPPKTQFELSALARILQVESTRDCGFECHVPGSARDLARALAEGVIALQIDA